MSDSVKIPANKYLSSKQVENKLQIALDNSLNVALIGRHGVGKTNTVLSVLKKNNTKFLYFSGSTLDPWVDFVGIPVKSTDANGVNSIDYLRPKDLLDPDLEVIIIDEFNRSPKKVRNAVMELIQFKSINGKKFPKLKCVWTGINPPSEGEYDVENLDPAQFDRFQMHIYVAYKPDNTYFNKKFGDFGKKLVSWWNAQSEEIKDQISPRRLDYVAEAIANNNTEVLDDILPKQLAATEIKALIGMAGSVSLLTELKKLTADELKTKAQDEEFLNKYLGEVVSNPEVFKILTPYIPKDKLESITTKLSTEVGKIYTDLKEDQSAQYPTLSSDRVLAKLTLKPGGTKSVAEMYNTALALTPTSSKNRLEIIKGLIKPGLTKEEVIVLAKLVPILYLGNLATYDSNRISSSWSRFEVLMECLTCLDGIEYLLSPITVVTQVITELHTNKFCNTAFANQLTIELKNSMYKYLARQGGGQYASKYIQKHIGTYQ